MIDFESITTRLEKLKEYAAYLKAYQKISFKTLKEDHTLQGAVFHYLQLSIECVIDIGEILISGLKLRKPNQSRDVMEILSENNIIPDKLAKKFYTAISFRNILVHDYLNVDIGIVFNHLQKDSKDFDTYAKTISKHLLNNAK